MIINLLNSKRKGDNNDLQKKNTKKKKIKNNSISKEKIKNNKKI